MEYFWFRKRNIALISEVSMSSIISGDCGVIKNPLVLGCGDEGHDEDGLSRSLRGSSLMVMATGEDIFRTAVGFTQIVGKSSSIS